MDDLISRQAALEKVRAMQTYKLFEGDDMILVDKAEVQTELMMLPTAQPEVLACGNGELVAQPEQHWIPVSERMPEESGYYITSNEYGGVNEDFYHDGHFWNADKNAYEVTAWMPKPSPYQKGATP